MSYDTTVGAEIFEPSNLKAKLTEILPQNQYEKYTASKSAKVMPLPMPSAPAQLKTLPLLPWYNRMRPTPLF